MARLVPAGMQFIDDVREVNRDAKAVGYGEPDGINVIREVAFDEGTSKWLAPIMEALTDPRIVGNRDVDGRLVVTFSARHLADFRTPFPVKAVMDVFDSVDADKPEPRKAAKKTPAKKAAKKAAPRE